MNAMLFWSLASFATLVVAGLSFYAWSLWREVRRREAFREDEIRRAHEQCLFSLEAISGAMLAEQMDLVEGALRCKVLLEIIDPGLMEREAFRPFAAVHGQTAHLHTHSARKALTPRQRMQEDHERLNVAEEHKVSLLEAAQAVADFKAHWPRSLH